MRFSDENVAKAVEDIQNFFQQTNISKGDKAKINLIVEELFLRCQKFFGVEHEFSVQKRKWFWTPRVLIRIKGKVYNPLETAEKDDMAILSAEIMKNLLFYERAEASYRYKNGYNEIIISSKQEIKKIKVPGGSITAAILLAFAAAFIVEQLPQNLKLFILDGLAIPLLNTLMQLIVAVTIPTIFFSVVSAICVMDDVSTLSNIGLKIIRRFMIIMSLVILVSIVASAYFFPIVSFSGEGSVLLEEIIALMLSAIPDNIFKPFLEGNVLQIVMTAFLTSICIVILDQRIAGLKSSINEIKELLFKMMELILKTVPLTIFLSIFKTVLTTSSENLFSVWKLVATSYITYFVVSFSMLLYLKLRYKIDLTDFFKKNAPVFIISLTMLSGTASMMVNFDVCKQNLKIDPNLCDFWIPLSHTLFSPGTVNNFVICAFMGAIISEAKISVSQLFIIAFLAIQLSIVTPKVYGGSIAGFTVLLTNLGFSTEAIGVMMINEVFIINASSLFGMVLRNCELFDLSHQVIFSKTKPV